MKCTCKQCGAEFERSPGAVNRAEALGAPLHCGRACAGLARRIPALADVDRKANKAEYDRLRRLAIGDQIRAKKAAFYLQHREKLKIEHAIYRAANMHRHVEYCRQPAYRAKKSEYDMKRRALLQFGEFSEAFLLLQVVEKEIERRASRYEIYSQNGTLNKAQTRKRAL